MRYLIKSLKLTKYRKSKAAKEAELAKVLERQKIDRFDGGLDVERPKHNPYVVKSKIDIYKDADYRNYFEEDKEQWQRIVMA